VVHASRRLRAPAIEIRAISNSAGRRDRQQWNVAAAVEALAQAIPRALSLLGEGRGARAPYRP
jgi:hypothetical protein